MTNCCIHPASFTYYASGMPKNIFKLRIPAVPPHTHTKASRCTCLAEIYLHPKRVSLSQKVDDAHRGNAFASGYCVHSGPRVCAEYSILSRTHTPTTTQQQRRTVPAVAYWGRIGAENVLQSALLLPTIIVALEGRRGLCVCVALSL
jgi:hypothetical protein